MYIHYKNKQTLVSKQDLEELLISLGCFFCYRGNILTVMYDNEITDFIIT